MVITSISVHDILTFHRLDRGVYDALIRLGTGRDAACNAVALFMWLEQIGINPISYIYSNPNRAAVTQMLAEAEAILDCACAARAGLAIPVVSSLVNEPLDLGFFCSNRDVMVRGVVQILDGVGRVIFDVRLDEVYAEYESSVQEASENKPWKWQPPNAAAAVPRMPQELAKPYKLHATVKPEEERTLFVTFYNGALLSRQELAEYFTLRWGNCVEKVGMQSVMMMITATSRTMPTYGRVVFTSDSYICLMLSGKQTVKLIINGRVVWFQRFYQPNDAAASTAV